MWKMAQERGYFVISDTIHIDCSQHIAIVREKKVEEKGIQYSSIKNL